MGFRSGDSGEDGGVPTLLPNLAVITDGSGQLTTSITTATEISYSSGLTGNIQTQLNALQPAGNYITALTGDGTATGPGSVALTLATVNADVGTFGNSTNIPQITVNAKGLITAASNVAAAFATTTLNNLGVTAVNADINMGVNNITGTGTVSATTANFSTVNLVVGNITGVSGAAPSGGTATMSLTLAQLAGSLVVYSASDATANATGTGNVLIESGNKTAGTGNSGYVQLYTGTSSGGTRGKIRFRDGTEGTAGQYWKSTDTIGNGAWSSITQPTVQKFASGSGNYTTPANVRYIQVQIVGGGGGGGGSGSSGGGNGGAGGNTTFGGTLLVANGGSGGQFGANGGAGGTSSLGVGPIGMNIDGGVGNAVGNGVAGYFPPGGGGASSFFGGAGGGIQNNVGNNAKVNSGGGGGGAGGPAAGQAGGGGGSGGFASAIIYPTAGQVFTYAVGAAGTAGTAGVAGFAGGAGGSGYVIVWEYY